MIIEHNVETGSIQTREMNAQELAQFEADKAAHAIQSAAQAQVEAAKTALLAKLGITTEEAALLLG